jgi:AcrR family transcriptional regulator
VNREEKKALTHDKIVSEAFKMFNEQGIRATDMKMISTASGISTVTFYKYFASKEALVQATVYYAQERQLAFSAAIINNDDFTFPQKLMALISAERDGSGAYSEEFLEATATVMAEDNRFAQSFEANYDRTIQAMIDQGRAAGYIAPTATDRALRFLIESTIEYERQHHGENDLNDQSFGLEVAALFFFGLFGAPNKSDDTTIYDNLADILLPHK